MDRDDFGVLRQQRGQNSLPEKRAARRMSACHDAAP
jgi:hypothetical protein